MPEGINRFELYDDDEEFGSPSQLNDMLKKKERLGGLVVGYHGTSAKRAREIQQSGFKNARCVEGGYGVYFWDDDYPNNALLPARDAAKKDGENQYAVIKARCKNASPDLRMGRPQWLVNADDIEILDIQFFEK